MRPKSIVLFEQAFLASMALAVVGMALSWSTLTAQLDQDPAMQAAGLGAGFVVGTIVLTLALFLLLWFFIARRASRIAKWILVVLIAFGTVSTVLGFAGGAPLNASALVGLANTALQIFAAWQLFQPDAKAWLASSGRDGPVDPTTFD